jgi:phosphate transport system protein
MTTLKPRETLKRQIQELQEEILILGSMVEQAVINAVESLRHRDLNAARQIYNDDLLVNQKRYEIENQCIAIIATQQPMARDLRILAAMLEINTELERMGDYAKGIARINLLMGSEPLLKPPTDISVMAELAASMLHRALAAFVNNDVQLAEQIPDEDERVDELYNKVFRDLVTIMIANPGAINRANYLLWAAHNLERMADRVTNICERTIYVVTGNMLEMDISDDEFRNVNV